MNDTAEKLAVTAMTKRANTAQDVLNWFRSLPPEQRNAIIGSLIGGVSTGAASAATDNNALLDTLLGAGLGATAGYGGTRALQHILGNAPVPSAAMKQNWDTVRQALPPDAATQLGGAATTGLATGAAGYGAGKWLEDVYRKVEGMASAESPFKGGVEGAAKDLYRDVAGTNAYGVMRDRARRVADAIAMEEMKNVAIPAADSWNPIRKIMAARAMKRSVPEAVYQRMKEELGSFGGKGYARYGGEGLGSKGVREVLLSHGKSVENAARLGRRAAKSLKSIPRLGRYGALLAVPAAAYSLLGGGE